MWCLQVCGKYLEQAAFFARVMLAAVTRHWRTLGRFARLVDIDAFTQFLAGLEVGHVFGRQRDRFAGLGVASHPGRAIVQGEAAEAADLDAVTRRQRQAHLFDEAFDGQLHILMVQMTVLSREQFD